MIINLACIHCEQTTIAKKWLVLSTLFPFIFLFLQIKCGRCKKEQEYDLDLNIIVDLLLSFVLPILLTIAAIYVLVFTNGNFWLMGLIFVLLYFFIRGIKLLLLQKKYNKKIHK